MNHVTGSETEVSHDTAIQLLHLSDVQLTVGQRGSRQETNLDF